MRLFFTHARAIHTFLFSSVRIEMQNRIKRKCGYLTAFYMLKLASKACNTCDLLLLLFFKKFYSICFFAFNFVTFVLFIYSIIETTIKILHIHAWPHYIVVRERKSWEKLFCLFCFNSEFSVRDFWHIWSPWFILMCTWHSLKVTCKFKWNLFSKARNYNTDFPLGTELFPFTRIHGSKMETK